MYKEYIEKIAAKDYSDLARRMRVDNIENLYDSGASQHAERIRKARQANQAKINASNKANSQRAIDGLTGIREDLAPKVKPIPKIAPSPSQGQTQTQRAIDGLKGIRTSNTESITPNSTPSITPKVKPAPNSTPSITPKVKPAPKIAPSPSQSQTQTQSQRAIDGLKGIREDLAPKVKPTPNSASKSKSLNIKRYGEPGQRFKRYKPDTKSGLAKLSTKGKIGAGALALGAGATAYGIYRNSQKNKEKTALDIVIDAFEKI